MAKKQNLRELEPDDLCGCGSGEPYSHCHKLTAVKYFKDDKGDISYNIPISNELMGLLEDTSARFRKVFGRKQRGNEPILFEKFLAGKEPLLFQAALKVANLAGVDEELIYAWRKTGLIVAEQNSHLIPNVDKKEWQLAIQEYRRIKRKGKPFS
ncbi:SEC-C domain-containing protein [Mesorhizobium sp. J8]|uniref:SEC-C domain-containing protein n=1 Tax=Mesorhizobium sp. J8 TaxID=2777475 RepID=UPI001915F9E9|nr:SEC-C domain-containing protein [Mesorhizobium sp. J8]